MYNLNYKHLLDRIRYVCGTWSNRTLSLKGKVTVINTLLASILQYPTAVIHTPPRVLMEYRKIVLNFLWNGKRAKIAYKTLTLPTERGGLRLMDLESRVEVNLLQWIRRVLKNPQASSILLCNETWTQPGMDYRPQILFLTDENLGQISWLSTHHRHGGPT